MSRLQPTVAPMAATKRENRTGWSVLADSIPEETQRTDVRPVRSDTLKTKLITSPEGFQTLQADWNRLLPNDTGSELPLTWIWFDAWLRSFWEPIVRQDPRAQLHIVVVSDDQGVAAIAPLAIHTYNYHGLKVRATKSLANGSTPYWDLVLRPGLGPPAIESICAAVFAAAPTAIAVLKRLRDSSPLRAFLAQSRPASWVDRDVIRTPLVTCTGTLEAHLSRLSRSYRKDLRRALRTFAAAPGTRVQKHLLSSGSDPLFDELVAVSRRSWKAASGNDLGSYHTYRQFLIAIVDRLGPHGQAEAWMAYQGDEAIAFELNLRSGSVLFPIQADYSESSKTLSPGIVVMHHVLAAAFEDPSLETYDTCAAGYWYLQRMTNTYREAFETIVFSNALPAWLIRISETGIKPAVRWLRRTLPKQGQPQT